MHFTLSWNENAFFKGQHKVENCIEIKWEGASERAGEEKEKWDCVDNLIKYNLIRMLLCMRSQQDGRFWFLFFPAFSRHLSLTSPLLCCFLFQLLCAVNRFFSLNCIWSHAIEMVSLNGNFFLVFFYYCCWAIKNMKIFL